jgi:flagellar biosynthesis component FlhA
LERKDFDPLEIIRTQLRVVEELIGVLNMDKITLEVGFQLVSLVDKDKGAKLLEGINNLRKTIFFPPVHILDNLVLNENEYRIMLNGTEIFRDQCKSANESIENTETIVNKLKEIVENNEEALT